MNRCCLNCRHCIVDFANDYIGCDKDMGEWVERESEDYYTPSKDWCNLYEELPDEKLPELHPL